MNACLCERYNFAHHREPGCWDQRSPAVSSDWEGAFLSKEEVEIVKALIDTCGPEYSPHGVDLAAVRALGRRLGMPDMGTE